MNLSEAVKRIVTEALAENNGADPVVDDTAQAIVHSLVTTLESDSTIGDNAFEMMMGSNLDQNRLTQVRLEDVKSTAELVVAAIKRDAALHAALLGIAESMIESASNSAQKDGWNE